MKTHIVNVKREPFDLYIGRVLPGYPQSIWANPFRIGRDGTRSEVLVRYRAYLAGRPELLAQLDQLRGLRLGCWCKPSACHGDILIELLSEPAELAIAPLQRSLF